MDEQARNGANTGSEERGQMVRSPHADERRRSLVQAAFELIGEKGFEELRTRDVAQRAGVNIATLHYYFRSKEELIEAVVDSLLSWLSSEALPEATPEASRDLEPDYSTPLGQLRAMFLNTQYRLQHMPEKFVVLGELVMRSLRYPALQAAIQRMDEQWYEFVSGVLVRGQKQGQFRADFHPEAMAWKIIILMKGITYHHIWSQHEADFAGLLKDIERWVVNEDESEG